MAWGIGLIDDCAVVTMNTNKVNVQNDSFFADLHDAFNRLERDFNPCPVVLLAKPMSSRRASISSTASTSLAVAILPKSASGIGTTALQTFGFSSIHGPPSQRSTGMQSPGD